MNTLAAETASSLTLWCDWTTLAANIVTIIGFLAAAVGIFLASRKFFRQRSYEQLTTLYSLCNALYRAGLRIQKKKDPTAEEKKANLKYLIDATNDLKNWFYDNRFLFDNDQQMADLVKAVTDEAKQIAATSCMTKLMELKTHLEKRLKRAP